MCWKCKYVEISTKTGKFFYYMDISTKSTAAYK